jgi:hypothetical protein
MIEDIKNVVNILFFIIVAWVAVLTYLRARKTVFAPLRRETFKLQLKMFEELLLFFQYKNESDFVEDFDLGRIVDLNAMRMRDAYATAVFVEKIEFDKDEQRKLYEPLRFCLLDPDDLEHIDEESHRKPLPKPDPTPETPALVHAKWKTYKHSEIGYTKVYRKRIKDLERFIASPLLPQALRDGLERFRAAVDQNLVLVGKINSEAAQIMPEKFTTVEEVVGFHSDWIWNRYNKARVELEPIATELVAFMNKYLKVDGLTSLET